MSFTISIKQKFVYNDNYLDFRGEDIIKVVK